MICALALLAGLAGCQRMPIAPPARATVAPVANAPTANAPAATTPGGYAVLFDASHGETSGNADWVISTSRPDPLGERVSPHAETDWTGALSAWGVALHTTGRYRLMTLPRGGQISYGERTNQLDLANFNVFVVPEPNVRFADAEKTAIMTFVQNGGGLFMIADHDGSDRNRDGVDSLRIWNDLMSDNAVQGGDPFGFHFDTLNIGLGQPARHFARRGSQPGDSRPVRHSNRQHYPRRHNCHNRASQQPTRASVALPQPRRYAGHSRRLLPDQRRSAKGAWPPGATARRSTMEPARADEQLFDGWDDAGGSNAILALNATEWLAQGGAGVPAAANIPTPSRRCDPSHGSQPEQSGWCRMAISSAGRRAGAHAQPIIARL